MKILFTSLGCDKNLVDSEHMLGLLTGRGYEMTDDEAEADIILINTCCFIHDAKEESVSGILEMAEYRKTGSCRALIVTAVWPSATDRKFWMRFRRWMQYSAPTAILLFRRFWTGFFQTDSGNWFWSR